MPENKKLDIPVSTIIKIVLVLFLFWVIYLIRDVLIVLFFALIIASAIEPFGEWLDKKKFSRIYGILFLYLAVFALLVFLAVLFLPSFINDLKDMANVLPQYSESIAANLKSAKESNIFIGKFIDAIQRSITNVIGDLSNIGEKLFGTTRRVLGGVVSFVSVIVISFYLAVQKHGIENFLKSITPSVHEAYVLSLWQRVRRKIGRWLTSQLILGVIVGVMNYIWLSILGIKFALALAILSGVLEIVPMVGPVLSAIPGVILAFFQSPLTGFLALILYGAVQQFENHVLVPIIVGRVVELNPLTVIVALLTGGALAGIIGMIMAVPIAAILGELFNDFVEKKRARNVSLS